MDFNEYIPKGFNSWHQYYKYQAVVDCATCILVGIILAVIFTINV